MSVDLSAIEEILKHDPKNIRILELVLNQYVQKGDRVSLYSLLDFYRGQLLQLPKGIQTQLANACLQLGEEKKAAELGIASEQKW